MTGKLHDRRQAMTGEEAMTGKLRDRREAMTGDKR
jgi:hypothetical protein